MKVTTIYGDVDDALLEKCEKILENGMLQVEYYQNGELVHRSATIRLIGTSAAADSRIVSRPNGRVKGD